MRRAAAAICFVAACAMPTPASAQPGVEVDRVVVRFESPELGGADLPQFVFARELAFEARLEALAEARRGFPATVAFEDRHLRSALERHIAEVILQRLPAEPPVSNEDLRLRSVSAWLELEQRVGGRSPLLSAATAEGLEQEDLQELVLRQARASLYLDRMVVPLLEPSNAELRDALITEPTPFRGQPFDQVATPLRHWYVEDRVVSALASFYQSARARIRIVTVARE